MPAAATYQYEVASTNLSYYWFCERISLSPSQITCRLGWCQRDEWLSGMNVSPVIRMECGSQASVLWFVFSVIHRCGRAAKNGESLGIPIM